MEQDYFYILYIQSWAWNAHINFFVVFILYSDPKRTEWSRSLLNQHYMKQSVSVSVEKPNVLFSTHESIGYQGHGVVICQVEISIVKDVILVSISTQSG